MKSSELEALLDVYVPALREVFQLNQYALTWEVGALQEKNCAEISINQDYETASLIFDAAKLDTEEDVIDAVRHELFHVLLAEFETFRRSSYQHVLTPAAQDSLEVLWTSCSERTVVRLERLFDVGVKVNLKEMAKSVKVTTPDN